VRKNGVHFTIPKLREAGKAYVQLKVSTDSRKY
jgi:hypothetical protein